MVPVGSLRRAKAAVFRRLRPENRIWALAMGIGIAGGGVACLYYAAMTGLMGWVWSTGPLSAWPMPLTCALGGTLVGVATWRFGAPGEISTVVNNLHLRNGR